MKTSKKILSVVMALVMLTTMVTSAFYASACNSNNHDPYKEAATVLDTIDNKLDAYDVDITAMLDGLLNSKDLIDTVNGYISEEKLNSYLSSIEAINTYLESGEWLIDFGNEKVAELLEKYLNTGTLDPALKAWIEGKLKDLVEKLPDVAYLDALFPTVAQFDAMLEELIGDYLDGEKLIKLLDDLVADAIEGKLVYDENGRKILKGIDGDLAASLDPMIENAIGKYVNDGTELLKLGDEKLMELLNNFEVLGVPVMQLRYISTLDALVRNLVLADGSDIMNTAANALKGIFPDVEPTYESIISCLIPILSALNVDDLLANMSNIAGMLQLASPSAFAYLAGLESPKLDPDYLDNINSELTKYGYTGTLVEPIINLDAAKAAKLLEYVDMEKGGSTLGEIAEAGFNWKDFAGDTDYLDIANAFVKIALGDSNKLGKLTSTPGLGAALSNILCDLLNDIKDAPVSVILKKISNAEDLAVIADTAVSMIAHVERDYMSYDLFTTESIYYDRYGNTTFYDRLDENGNPEYTGPYSLDQYLPVIAAALDFLSGISDKVENNGGDILKTLFVDKLPQLENVLKSLISYKDSEGNTKVGAIGYLLDDYKDYLLANDAIASYDLLIGLAEASIESAQESINKANDKIAIWQDYLKDACDAEDAAKLAKAISLGILPADTTEYDEDAVNAAIEAKILDLRSELETLEAKVAASEQAAADAQAAYDAAVQREEDCQALMDSFYDDPFYSDLCDIFDEEDVSYIDHLRDDCKDDFDAVLGEGAFEDFATLIIEHLDEFAGDADTFMEYYLFGEDGMDIYTFADELFADKNDKQDALDAANAALEADEAARDAKADELAKYETGAILKQIQDAGNGATIYIFDERINADNDFTSASIRSKIDSINSEEIGGYNATIAEQQNLIQDYIAAQNEQQSIVDNYDLEGLNLEQEAFNSLIDSLMTFLGGDDNTKSLYEYFEDGQPIEMLVAPDRVNALKNIIDNLITLFGDKIGSGADYTTRLWDIEDKLFGSDGILSTLYNDFIDDPVLSIVTRIAPLADIIDIVYDMGFLRDYIDQYKDLIDAVAGIFGDDSEGFIAQWKQAYADGSANHHYVNAVLSLLPNIVNIYDQVKNIDAVKELLAPYSDLIEIVLGLLSKDFYDDVINNGIVETLLEDENLENLRDTILKVLDMVDIENKDQIKALVNQAFDKILDGLYQDLLVDPVTAISKRISAIADLVKTVTDMFNIDISDYEFLIDDIKNIFDDNFAKDWQKSKVTALVNRITPIADLLDDILDFAENTDISSLLENIPEEGRDIFTDENGIDPSVIELARALTKLLRDISTDLIKDYHKSPVRTIAKRVPAIVEFLEAVEENSDIITDALASIEAANPYEKVVKLVLSHLPEILPVIKEVVNEDLVDTYEKDKYGAALKVIGGAAEIVKDLIGDSELVDEALNLLKDVKIGDITVSDISGVIKAAAPILANILKDADLVELISGLQDKPVETIAELKEIISQAISEILATDDPTITQYTDQLKKTLELVKDLLDDITLDGDKIVISFVDSKKPIDSILSSDNIKKLVAALKEVQQFTENMGASEDITDGIGSLADIIKSLDGAVERIRKQPLLTSVEKIAKVLETAKPFLNMISGLEIGGFKIGDFLDLVDPVIAVLDGIGKDAEKSLVGAVLSRIDKLGDLVRAVFANETICNIEVGGYKIGDFKEVADIALQILDKDFYKDYTANPLKAIFDRIDYIKALYEWLKDFGLADMLGDKVVLLGYNLLDAVDILLPVLDKQLYYDFEQSLFKALTSSSRIGRIEKALKDLIRFADIFSYSVNEGLCSAISGLCGVLDGLYDSLVLPASPANGGNQLHSTSRVIVKKLPAIQNLLRSLEPLLGKGKLLNLTDVVSDTVKMEKDDILKLVAGIDLVKPYYYGISDVLDVVGENAAKYDWNTIPSIIDALNGVGEKLVPALEDALGVSDVTWKDLKTPTPEYAAGGTAEDYLVELSGELGEGILTQLVGTLLKAALTIPAVKDLIGDVGPEEVAGLLNDLLEFDFKDNTVEFDAFNTEHLIYTGVNLLLPKTAPAPSPATADEVVIIAVALGTTAAASTGVFLTLKKRREEMEVNA